MVAHKTKKANKGSSTTIRVTGALHAEIRKLAITHGYRVEALADALLQYATEPASRVDDAISEYQARASKATAARREREGPPQYVPPEPE